MANRIFAGVRGILDVMARQFGAIGTGIGPIDSNIQALRRKCEASRRIAEIPDIDPLVAAALAAEFGDWKYLNRVGRARLFYLHPPRGDKL